MNNEYASMTISWWFSGHFVAMFSPIPVDVSSTWYVAYLPSLSNEKWSIFFLSGFINEAAEKSIRLGRR